MPVAASWAALVVDSLNAAGGQKGATYRLVDPDSAAQVGSVQFLMAVGDTVYRVSYDVRDGMVTGRPVVTDRGLSVRNFLTTLHKTRGYSDTKAKGRPDGRPTPVSAMRWGWALVVDAVGLLMLFWACSGLVMWWQLRSLRVVGALVLGASATAAALLAIGLRHALTG